MALEGWQLRLEFLSGLAPSHILDKDLIPLFKLKETMYNQKNNEGQEDDTIEPLVKRTHILSMLLLELLLSINMLRKEISEAF